MSVPASLSSYGVDRAIARLKRKERALPIEIERGLRRAVRATFEFAYEHASGENDYIALRSQGHPYAAKSGKKRAGVPYGDPSMLNVSGDPRSQNLRSSLAIKLRPTKSTYQASITTSATYFRFLNSKGTEKMMPRPYKKVVQAYGRRQMGRFVTRLVKSVHEA